MATSVIEHLRRAVLLRDGAGLGDGELLGCFIERHDEAALGALVKRHGPMVWGVCRRLLSHHDAEDAFQATFIVLVRKAASIVPRVMVGNWLYGVAHQTALQARRTATRRRAREVQVTEMPDTATVQPDQWPDVRPLLDQELSRLPENYRAVVVLCDLEGRTRKEVARQLGVPEGTVAGRLPRARAMLAKRLTQRGVALSGGALAAVLAQQAALAGVPNSVVDSTITAASLLAAGKSAATGAISVKVAVLTEGVLKAMLMRKLKAVVAVVLVLGFVATGTTILTLRTATAQSATPAPPIVAAQDTKSILEGSKAGDRKELAPGIAFRWCPAGEFKMGEGDDAIDVELSKGFWLGETEVTQGQWKKLMGTSPWSGRTGVGARASNDNTPPKEGSDYAASYISYDDALSFCKKLTTQEQDAGRLPKSWTFSLPTEAKWEYACRAGTKTKFSFGDDESQLSQYAWFGDHSGKEPYARQVGLKKSNAWGLCDMHGNVWEWCSDWFGSKRSGGKDRVGPTTLPPPVAPPSLPDGTPGPPVATSARNRVIRGGSWVDNPLTCTSANRFYTPPDFGNGVQGFRLAAVPVGHDDKKPMAEKPVEPAAKQEKEKEAFTAWGKEIGGLQAGLGFHPGQKRPYSHGETVKLVVRVRNVGKEEVSFQYVSQFLIEIPPAVTDGKGKLVPAALRSLFGIHLPKQVNLAPEKEIELYGELEVRPDFGTGKVSVQYERVFGNSSSRQIKLDPNLSKLATGKLELEIKADERVKMPPKDLSKIEPPGGVPLFLGRKGEPIRVDGIEKARARLEAVPAEDLEKWVVELERIMDKKLNDGLPSARQVCRTDFVIRVSVAFDDLKWNAKTADNLFKRAQTMPASEAKVWKEALEALLKKEIGQTDTEVYAGGPAWAVPLVLIPVDALHEGQKYSAERGKKYLARMRQLTANDVSLWKDQVDEFEGTKLDAAVNIILLDDFFDKERFQRGKFKNAIGARKK